MSGANTAARVDAVMQREGTTMVLKRKGLSDLDVKGVPHGSSDIDTGNTAAQSERKVRIGNGEISLAPDTRAPRRTDKIVIDGKTMVVLHVDTKKHAGVTVAHVLTVAG